MADAWNGAWGSSWGVSWGQAVVEDVKRGGAAYLTQAELRALRRRLDEQERRERQVDELIELSARGAYERLLRPQVHTIEDDEEELILILTLTEN